MELQSSQYFSQSYNKNGFTKEIFGSTNNLFKGEKQKFTIIWGDKNKNNNMKTKNELILKNKMLENSIYECSSTEQFREMVIKSCEKNLIFIMSGTFAIEEYEETKNIEWLNNMIKEQMVHSKSIILFTSEKSVVENKWNIEQLQKEYCYVTQIAVKENLLYDGVNKMIYNRLHRSLDQAKNLDLYFGSKTDEILSYFLNQENIRYKACRPSSNDLLSKLNNLFNYIIKAEMKTPIAEQVDSVNKFYEGIENCFYQNYITFSKDIYLESQLIKDILKYYTQESCGYKILNYSLNTMNPIIYEQLSTIYQLFSKCLYDYKDGYSSEKLTLYRGAAIQKYQYDNLYNEFQINEKNNSPTFIIFPQFLSTSLSEDIATDMIKLRFKEANQSTQARIMNEIKQTPSKNNFDFLKNKVFQENYQVQITIQAQIDLSNKYRPKFLKEISTIEKEQEFLFQPFQAFKVKNIENTIYKTKDSICHIELQYVI